MEKRIVVGHKGEIGRAIFNIFEATDGIDKHSRTISGIILSGDDRTVLHICIPYNNKFIPCVLEYVEIYNPDLLIIHSTVPVGTTRKIYNQVTADEHTIAIVHCPVNGRHPNMEKDIRLYDIYVGSIWNGWGNETCDYIERFGIRTYLFNTPEATEFCKLASTEYCRTMVKFFGEMKDLADRDKKLNWNEIIIFFESLMNKSDGWKRMYRRGNRIDTKISGKHCLSLNKPLMEMYKNDNKNM